MVTPPDRGRVAPHLHRAPLAAAVALVAAAWLVAPEAAVLGWNRLAPTLVLACGAWLVVGRVGAIDLSLGAAAGVGGVGVGVLASVLDVDGWLLLPVAAVGGAVVGAVAGMVTGRVGRVAGALATLALGTGIVAVARAVEVLGGRSGFHAVPLLAASDVSGAVLSTVVVAASVATVAAVARRPSVARAAVAVAAPPVAEAAGRRPGLDVASVGAVGGALAGVSGLLSATATGSVQVDGFGADLAATAVLLGAVAAGVARFLPTTSVGLSPLLAGLLVAGPSVVFPLAPIVGTAPVLLTAGPLGLAVVVAAHRRGARPAPAGVATPAAAASGPPSPRTPLEAGLRGGGLAIPAGTVDLEVAPGEVVALVGPNGTGKSTVLARLGGQLPDGGGTRIDDAPAPAGSRRRALLGLARGWQRAPDVDAGDLLATAEDADAAAWADAVLPPVAADEDVGTHAARAQLVALTARCPSVVLLDEPAAPFPTGADAVGRWLRGLADAGAAVVVVEHRPEVLAVADRRVALERVAAPTRTAGRDEADPDGSAPVLAPPLPGTTTLGEVQVAPDVTVLDHLRTVPGAPDDAALRALLATAPLLTGRGGDPAGWLSGGERQVLGWLRVLAAPTEHVVLDGAGRGLDPATLDWATARVADLRDAGVGVEVVVGRAEEEAWRA